MAASSAKVPPGFCLGYDFEKDAKRFTVTDSGVVVIPKGELIEREDDAGLPGNEACQPRS